MSRHSELVIDFYIIVHSPLTSNKIAGLDMKQLIAAYQRVLRKKNVLFNWLIVFFVFSWNVWTFDSSNIPFPLGLFSTILIGGMILWYLHERTKKAESFLLHRLIEPGDVEHFLSTIDHEIQRSDAISVCDDISGVYLYITQTWIVLFSTGASFVRQIKNVVSVESEFNPEQSKTSIHFAFSNGEKFGCFCNDNHEEILKLFSREGRGTHS